MLWPTIAPSSTLPERRVAVPALETAAVEDLLIAGVILGRDRRAPRPPPPWRPPTLTRRLAAVAAAACWRRLLVRDKRLGAQMAMSGDGRTGHRDPESSGDSTCASHDCPPCGTLSHFWFFAEARTASGHVVGREAVAERRRARLASRRRPAGSRPPGERSCARSRSGGPAPTSASCRADRRR